MAGSAGIAARRRFRQSPRNSRIGAAMNTRGSLDDEAEHLGTAKLSTALPPQTARGGGQERVIEV